MSRLIQILNYMLEKLEGAFAAQTRSVNDAAHGLRTPLAVPRTELEVALNRPRTETEYQQFLGSNLEEVERLGWLAENLLLLSRHNGDEGLPMDTGVPLRL